MTTLKVAGTALAALLVAGCAADENGVKPITTGSLRSHAAHEPHAAAGVQQTPRNADDTLRAFCAQRHVDYQAGKAPGGAKSLEQKQADDRLCEALGRQG